MPWTGDPRTSTTAWRKTRLRILKRDGYICHVCEKPGADQVDHIKPHAECLRLGIDPDVDTNLAPIHRTPCHAEKSSREGNAARWAQRKRPAEQHPGFKGGG